jgi:uncharacterized protein (DUF433 family)
MAQLSIGASSQNWPVLFRDAGFTPAWCVVDAAANAQVTPAILSPVVFTAPRRRIPRDNDTKAEMNIEIHKPELERRVREGIRSGRFNDVDELLTKALDALSKSSPTPAGILDWSQCPAVESVSAKLGGQWVFRNTRMPVAGVFENLEDGVTIDELVELYAGLTRDQIKSVLEFASRSVSGTPASIPPAPAQ